MFVEGQIDAIANSVACIKSVEFHQFCLTNMDGPMSAGLSRSVSNFRSDWQGFYVNFVLSEKDRSSCEKCVDSRHSVLDDVNRGEVKVNVPSVMLRGFCCWRPGQRPERMGC